MTNILQVGENKNYTAISVGSLSKLMEHSLVHPKLGHTVEGKVLIKDAVKATGTEISFNILPPRTDVAYFHIHHKNEETYIIIQGSGDFQVDDDCFEISEGSIVRVAPEGKRGLRNSSDSSMIYIVIQSKEGSLEEHTFDDGARIAYSPKWKQQ